MFLIYQKLLNTYNSQKCMFRSLSIGELAIIYSIIVYALEQKNDLDHPSFEIIKFNSREYYSINDLLKIINN